MTKKMQKLTAQNNSFVALITPFKKGKVDFKALEKLIEFQIENGIDGIVPCGTTGESPTLSHQEHNEIIEFAVKIAKKRVKVMAGTGSNSTSEAVEMTKYAKKVGANAIAHGSTGAGNDQVRFDMVFHILIPGVEVITPIRDNKPRSGGSRHGSI